MRFNQYRTCDGDTHVQVPPAQTRRNVNKMHTNSGSRAPMYTDNETATTN